MLRLFYATIKNYIEKLPLKHFAALYELLLKYEKRHDIDRGRVSVSPRQEENRSNEFDCFVE